MKYITAAIILSCLLAADAKPASVASSGIAAAAMSTEAAAFASLISEDPMQSLVGAGIGIRINEEDEENEGNSPALADNRESDEEEDEETEETEEGLLFVDGNVDENIFASAGLVYNKDVDLPVYSKGAATSDEDYPPVPEVVACRTDGQIAITYSDGPSDATARIARQLNTASAPGNFFVNTKWLNQQQYAMVLQNIYNAGHLIGMTYRLPNEEPEAMSDEEIRADIINNAHMIESLIQVAPKYVRLHFSAQNDGRAEHILRDLGFILVGYNLDGRDYVHQTGEKIAEEYSHTFKQYREAHNAKGSFVAVQYDIPETASLIAVPHIIKAIASEGYTAVRMDGCLNDAKPYKLSASGLEYVGDKFSFGSAGYRSGQKVSRIISTNSTTEEEIRGLSANNDEFLNGASSTSNKIAIAAFIPALLIAFMI